jgi:hypothetical protein
MTISTLALDAAEGAARVFLVMAIATAIILMALCAARAL